MNKISYTYRIKLILAGVLIWETIFWSLSGLVLFLIGYLDPSATGQQIAFKFPGQFWLLVFLFLRLFCRYRNLIHKLNFGDAHQDFFPFSSRIFENKVDILQA